MFVPGKWMPASKPAEVQALTWSLGGSLDASLVGQLALAAFDPHFREAWTEGQISGLLATPSAWLELGRFEGELAAFALCRQAQEEVELLLCATGPRWRRRGLGRQLVGKIAERACKRGATRMFLEVRSSNLAAMELYLACGFAAVGRRPDYYRTLSGESIDAITLSRKL